MKNKLIKKGGVLFLALFLFVFTPFSAFGYGTVQADGSISVVAMSSGLPIFQQTVGVYGEDGSVRFSDKREQTDLSMISIIADFNASVLKGDVLSLDFVIPLGRYTGFDFAVTCRTITEKGTYSKKLFETNGSVFKDTDITDGDMSYYYSYSATASSSNTFHYENVTNMSYTGKIKYEIVLKNFRYSTTDLTLNVYLNDFLVSVESPESTQGKKTLNFLEQIKQAIENVVTGITELPSKISSFFSQLGDRISGFFDGLSDSLSKWFAEIGKQFTKIIDKLQGWFADIGQWFTDLGNDIGEFFNKLFNKIWWGNEKGEAAYNPPVFSSKLTDVIKKIDEYCDSLQNVLNQIDSAASSVSSNIQQGTQIIEQTLGVFPSVIIGFITFGIVLIFARKVVGR